MSQQSAPEAWAGGPPPDDRDAPDGAGGNREGSSPNLDWEPPAAFGRVVVPPFPAAVLPGWLAAHVEAVATFSQTPSDLAGVLALATLSAAARGRWDIEAPAGHREPLCLYCAVAMPPGERKSSVFSAMTAPLVAWEQAELERTAPELAEDRAQRAVQEKRLGSLETKAAKSDDPMERGNLISEVVDLARELDMSEPPAPPRLLADDLTTEALVALLAEQDGRLALLSAEGGIFDVVAGLYHDGRSNLDGLLKAHDAECIRVDRRGRSPLHVPRATLTLGLAVQPVVLEGSAANSKFRGRGLVGRFLFSLPTSKVGHREVGCPPAPAAVAECYRCNLTALVDLEPAGESPGLLSCSPGALTLFRDFAAELEPRLAPYGGDLATVGDWAGKLAGALARIAGLLQLAEHLDRAEVEPVSEATMGRALALGPYLVDHALAAFAMMGADPEVEGARRVLRWLEHTGAKSFTAKECFDGCKGTFRKMDALKPALRLLEQHGYIREEEQEQRKGPGRKPSPRFDVNPLWCLKGEVSR